MAASPSRSRRWRSGAAAGHRSGSRWRLASGRAVRRSASRLICQVQPRHVPACILLAREYGLPGEELGTTGGDRLTIELTGAGATGAAEERGSRVADAVDVPVANLRHAWDHGLPRALGWDDVDGPEDCADVWRHGVVLPNSSGFEAAAVAATALFALQHRGQESAGLAVSDGEHVLVYKDLGLVTSVLDDRRLPSLRGDLAIAHCRYSTTGSTIWENAQPTFRLGPRRRSPIGHNGNLVNTRELLALRRRAARLPATTDTELLTALLAATSRRRHGRGAAAAPAAGARRLLASSSSTSGGSSASATRTASGRWSSAASRRSASRAAMRAPWALDGRTRRLGPRSRDGRPRHRRGGVRARRRAGRDGHPRAGPRARAPSASPRRTRRCASSS